MGTISRRTIIAGGLSAPLIATTKAAEAEAPTWPGPNATPDDYPQLMGYSDHTGFARTETTLTPGTVATMGAIWDKPMAGRTGPPIVVSTSVFIGGVMGLRRIDAATGRHVWARYLGGGRGVRTAPAYAHGIVVVVASVGGSVFPPGQVLAFNARTGVRLWSVKIPGGGVGYSSPSIVGSTVFVPDATFDLGESRVVALDLASGRQRWAWTDPGQTFGSISSPTLVNGLAVVGNGGNSLVTALQQTSGKVIWRRRLHDFGSNRLDGDTIAADRARGCVYVGGADGRVRALGLGAGAPVWTASVGDPVGQGVACTGEVVLANTESDVVALDSATGAERWRVAAAPLTGWNGLVAGGGLAYSGFSTDWAGSQGVLCALDLTDGTIVKRVGLLPDSAPTGAALSRGRLYVAQKDRLFCLGLGGRPVAP